MTLKKIISFAFGPILSAVLGFITVPIFTHFFSVEDIGKLALLNVFVSLCIMIFSLGLHQAYVREYYEYKDSNTLLKMAYISSISIFLLGSSIFYFLPFSLSFLLFEVNSVFISVMIFFLIFFALVMHFILHALRMKGKGVLYSLSVVLPKIMVLLFLVILFLFNFSYNFTTLFLIQVSASILANITFLFVTKRSWLPSIFKKIDKVMLKKMIKFSLPLVAGGLAFWAMTATDRFFLRIWSSYEELGYYSVAMSFASVATILSSVFSNLWHPTIYKWIKEGIDTKKVQQVVEIMLLVILTIWALAGCFSWLVSYMLPKKYVHIDYLVILCMIYPLLYVFSETTVVGIGISKKSHYDMFASLFAFCVNIILNYLLIPSYGAEGAAIASAIAFFIFFIIRTESSAYLWYSFSRKKIYILLILFITLTLNSSHESVNRNINYIIWLSALGFSYLVFYKRVSESYLLLRKKIMKRRINVTNI